VLLDGVPVGRYERASLAAKLGVVLQEPLILEGSLRDALTLRLPYAAPAAVVRAAELACFHEVVKQQPKGYETHIAPSGGNLSGGERQRLALCQALLGDPRFLLLDEATCALDPETECRILDNLARCSATVITIAHRSSVIERATRMFEVHNGAVTALSADSSGAGSMTRSGAKGSYLGVPT
jgi:ABC-type bacteriocin/lantibiotic exporter with double-glycine peptidase domain